MKRIAALWLLSASTLFGQVVTYSANQGPGIPKANYPAYSSSATQTVKCGPEVTTGGDWVAMVGATTWSVQLDPCRLRPGAYTLTRWYAHTFFTEAENVAEWRLVLYSLEGTTYTCEWSLDVASSLAPVDGSSYQDLTLSQSITIDTDPDKTWFLGVAVRNTSKAGEETKPGFVSWKAAGGTLGPAESVRWTAITNGAFAAKCQTLTSPTTSNVVPLMNQWTFTTRVRQVTKITAAGNIYEGSATKIAIPKITTADYILALKDVVVADGQSLTVNLCDQASAFESVKQTLTLNMGATDQVTFGGANVALNTQTAGTCTGGVYEAPGAGLTQLTLDTGTLDATCVGKWIQIAVLGPFKIAAFTDPTHINVTGNASTASGSAWSIGDVEAGDTFDIWLNLRPVANQIDAIWQNKTRGQGAESTSALGRVYQDIRAVSHNAARAGRQTTAVSNTVEPCYLSLSGTATIKSIEMCYEPLVMIGDSQICTKASGTDPLVDRLLALYLPGAFTYPRSHWNAGISGGSLAYDSSGYMTAAYKRYKSDTAGQGDLCELTGVVFVIVAGVNDIAGHVVLEAYDSGVGEAARLSRATTVMEMTKRLAEMVDDMRDRGNDIILVGLPPYIAAPEVHRAEAIMQWNYAIHGVALGARCAFYSPYAMVNASPSTYLYSDNLHYSDAGAQLVAPRIAAAYEAGKTSPIFK